MIVETDYRLVMELSFGLHGRLTPSSMAQDDRALEGEGVGGVSNGQAGLRGQCETT